jgi:hypothetical protein
MQSTLLWLTCCLAESAFGGSLSCVVVFGKNVFTFNVLYKAFYKFCTFNTIWKFDVAINCIILQHNKGSFPSTLTGHTMLVIT